MHKKGRHEKIHGSQGKYSILLYPDFEEFSPSRSLNPFKSEVLAEGNKQDPRTKNKSASSRQRLRFITVPFSRLIQRFKKKPYSTTFIYILIFTNIVPVSVFILVMLSLSSFFFLLHLAVFISVAIVAALFIIPFLTLSFIFASFVVAFAFLSDITFRIAQKIYLKVDHRLKYALNKMSIHKKGKQPENSTAIYGVDMDEPANNLSRGTIEVPADPSSAASGIARSLETRANLRVTS